MSCCFIYFFVVYFYVFIFFTNTNNVSIFSVPSCRLEWKPTKKSRAIKSNALVTIPKVPIVKKTIQLPITFSKQIKTTSKPNAIPLIQKIHQKSSPTQANSPSIARSGVQIPLHSGSKVLVYKEDLIRIYSTIPALYTARLAELVFGRLVLESMQNAKNIDSLEPEKMFSLTSEANPFKPKIIKTVFTNQIYVSHFQSTSSSCSSAARFQSLRQW